jgi:hypothetical protein
VLQAARSSSTVRVYPIKPPFVLYARAGEAERSISGGERCSLRVDGGAAARDSKEAVEICEVWQAGEPRHAPGEGREGVELLVWGKASTCVEVKTVPGWSESIPGL